MKRILHDYSFDVALLAIWFITATTHFVAGIPPFIEEQAAHGEPFSWGAYLWTWARDASENYASEWMAVWLGVRGLAWWYASNSPQDKREGQRLEAKLDALLRRVAPDDADRIITALDRRYGRQ
jgi:hypothetical protein